MNRRILQLLRRPVFFSCIAIHMRGLYTVSSLPRASSDRLAYVYRQEVCLLTGQGVAFEQAM